MYLVYFISKIMQMYAHTPKIDLHTKNFHIISCKSFVKKTNFNIQNNTFTLKITKFLFLEFTNFNS